jgi:hypothetical protein
MCLCFRFRPPPVGAPGPDDLATHQRVMWNHLSELCKPLQHNLTQASPSAVVDRLCATMRARGPTLDHSSDAFGDTCVSYTTACMGREWQLRISLPLNLWFAQRFRAAVRFAVVVYDTDDSEELLLWMKDKLSHFINNGSLVIGQAERDGFHAPVCKNSATALALATPWLGKSVEGETQPWEWCTGDRHAVVNLDADNLLSEDSISQLGQHLQQLEPGHAPLQLKLAACWQLCLASGHWLVAVPRLWPLAGPGGCALPLT